MQSSQHKVLKGVKEWNCNSISGMLLSFKSQHVNKPDGDKRGQRKGQIGYLQIAQITERFWQFWQKIRWEVNLPHTRTLIRTLGYTCQIKYHSRQQLYLNQRMAVSYSFSDGTHPKIRKVNLSSHVIKVNNLLKYFLQKEFYQINQTNLQKLITNKINVWTH